MSAAKVGRTCHDADSLLRTTRPDRRGKGTGHRLLEWACAWALFGAAPQAMAQVEWARLIDVQRLSATEWALLPEYCPYTQTYHKGGQAAYQDWINRVGFGFSAMHHYCWGLVKAHRASALGAQSQFHGALLASAIDEIEYVLRSTPADFLLRPEVLLRGGQFAVQLQDYPRAIDYFEASIRSKADYWPPYIEIANVNLAIRRREHAVEALKRGLSVMPAQPQLVAALARIEADSSLGTRTQRTPRP